MAKNLGLGRGLGALIKEVPARAAPVAPDPDSRRVEVPLSKIRKSPWQPRHDFDEASLSELAESIARHGVLQPLLVRQRGDEYELIAGERRFRAAQQAALAAVPVLLMDVSDQAALELALIENLQREDLNPIDEAEGYQLLTEKFNLTQEEIARQVGKGRATIANSLRLLELTPDVRRLLAEGRITVGHAKVLLGVAIPAEQVSLARRVVLDGLSVRELEKLLAPRKAGRAKPRVPPKGDLPEHHVTAIVDRLRDHFGAPVHLQPCRTLPNGKKSKGSLQIDFHSNDELDRVLQQMGITDLF